MDGERGRGRRYAFPAIALAFILLLSLVPAVLAAEPKEKWSQSNLKGVVRDVDITSSGRTVIATSDGLITFTDASGNILKQPASLSPAVRIASDGIKVAAGGASSVYLIDNAGTTLWEGPLQGTVTGVGMDRAAQVVAASADDKYVYLFDGSGKQLARVSAGEVPRGVATTGDRTVVGLPSGKVLLLDREGKTLLDADAGAPVNAVDISSSTLAAATDAKVVVLSHDGKVQWQADLGSPARAIATTADGSLVLAAAQAGDAALFNSKGEFLWRLKKAGEAFTGVGLSDGGTFAAVGSRESVLRFYTTEASEAKPEGAAAATPTPAATAAPTPTPRTESVLLDQPIGTPSRTVLSTLTSVSASWTKLQQTVSGTAAEVTKVAISPDGQRLAMASPRGLFFLDRSGNTQGSLSTIWSSITTLKVLRMEFTSDSQQLRVSGCDSTSGVQVDAVLSGSGTIAWSNTSSTGRCGPGAILAAADGKSFVNVTAGGTAAYWLDASRQPRTQNNSTINTSLSSASVADLSPDGKTLAAGFGNTTLEFYSDTTRIAKTRSDMLLFSISDLRFTPDGKLAVRSGGDVHFFDPGTVLPDDTLPVFWKRRAEGVLSWAVGKDAFVAGTETTQEFIWARGGKDIVDAKLNGQVSAVALSSNGKFAAAASKQIGKVWLYADDGSKVWEADVSDPGGVAVADDGSVLVANNPPGTGGTTAGALYLYLLPTLDVDSSPSGAKVTLDGADVGTTPVRIQGVRFGNRSLTVSLAGYKDCTGTVSVTGTVQRLCSFVSLSGASPPPATPTPSATAAAATPAPSASAAGSPTPAASATAAPVSPTPTPKKSPGFEALLGLGALGVAVALRKRRT